MVLCCPCLVIPDLFQSALQRPQQVAQNSHTNLPTFRQYFRFKLLKRGVLLPNILKYSPEFLNRVEVEIYGWPIQQQYIARLKTMLCKPCDMNESVVLLKRRIITV